MKKIMVCIDFQSESIDSLVAKLKTLDWSKASELHLTSCFVLNMHSFGFFPEIKVGEIQKEVQKNLDASLDALAKDLDLGEGIKVIKQGIISDSERESLAKYAQENKIDQMIISTREKHGIIGYFTSSFAEFMLRHSKSELLIIRD